MIAEELHRTQPTHHYQNPKIKSKQNVTKQNKTKSIHSYLVLVIHLTYELNIWIYDTLYRISNEYVQLILILNCNKSHHINLSSFYLSLSLSTFCMISHLYNNSAFEWSFFLLHHLLLLLYFNLYLRVLPLSLLLLRLVRWIGLFHAASWLYKTFERITYI